MDIESALIEWLGANTSIPWSGDVPKGKPPFGTVERTGGGIKDVVIDSPMVAIQLWGTTRSEAKDLAIEVRKILPRFAYEPHVRKVSIQSIQNFPDDDGKKPRYQVVAEIKTS